MTVAPRVAEIGDGYAVRYCGYLLACLGSPVTRRPVAAKSAHELAAAAFLDRGKQIIDAPPDLSQVDVLLTDEAIDAGDYPSLVVVHTSLFGSAGEYADLTGTDVQALALSGLMSMVGDRGREPLRIGGAQAELATGLSMFSAVMMGLFRRAGTGVGAAFDVSAVRTGAYLDWKSQIYHVAEGKVLQRGSESGPVILTCADGFVGFYYRDEEWPAVQKLIGDPRLAEQEFATQVLRDRNREEFVGILDDWSRRLTRDEVYQRSQALHIPAGSVLELAELADSPQVASRAAIFAADLSGLPGLSGGRGGPGGPGGGMVSLPAAPWTVDGVRGGR